MVDFICIAPNGHFFIFSQDTLLHELVLDSNIEYNTTLTMCNLHDYLSHQILLHTCYLVESK